MKNKLIALLAACCLGCSISAEQVEISIASKITVDSAEKEAVIAELKEDSKDLTEKYAAARGVTEVETTVSEEDCGCNHKEEVAAPEEAQESKCGCDKPKPESESVTRSEEAVKCEECAGHVQITDKVEKNVDGETVCSDCKEQLRSCKSCCKPKCCKKCSKCCSSCSSSSCCH